MISRFTRFPFISISLYKWNTINCKRPVSIKAKYNSYRILVEKLLCENSLVPAPALNSELQLYDEKVWLIKNVVYMYLRVNGCRMLYWHNNDRHHAPSNKQSKLQIKDKLHVLCLPTPPVELCSLVLSLWLLRMASLWRIWLILPMVGYQSDSMNPSILLVFLFFLILFSGSVKWLPSLMLAVVSLLTELNSCAKICTKADEWVQGVRHEN